ncbi:unnamed protein product [Peronospora effusa]|uniref:Uncharacterized protein n=1 Tax=Peronospora effusa TaxID=542832 RepID=A0A3M6VGN8_9STRA|nr:hypothetical protein DD238_002545 [Peronospora effusa]RQM09569.1 hypothetical protein DD237_003267 [Peronospora effusa]CAI5717788.1 unnamed protein product [Peronospora effusa]
MLTTKPENLESGTIKPENLESDAIKAESGTTKSEIIEENPEITESGLENPANFDSVKEIIERGSIKPKDFGEQALYYWNHLISLFEAGNYGTNVTPLFFRCMKTMFENDILIAYMIYKTMKSSNFQDTIELMMNLRNALFEKWLQEGKYPREINAMLKAAIKSDSDLEREIFDRIASQYDKFYGKVKVTMEDPGTSEEVKLDLSS